MNTPVIIGNWKSNKKTTDALSLLDEFSHIWGTQKKTFSGTILLCVPYTLLSTVAKGVSSRNVPIQIGVQDISAYPQGAYTGEVAAEMAAEFAQYALIGHSERRKHLGESEELLEKKLIRAHDAGLTPIYSIQEENSLIPDTAAHVMYEPMWAIGTGNSDSPEHVEEVAEHIRKKARVQQFYYGGSISSHNVSAFTKLAGVSGVLIGKASLTPSDFLAVIDASVS